MIQVGKKQWLEIVLFVKGARNFARGGLLSHNVDNEQGFYVTRAGEEVCVAETRAHEHDTEFDYYVEQAVFDAFNRKYGYDV